jgi:REP element-mobilizing transposase RayT
MTIHRPQQYHKRIRLPEFDYSSDGYYYVTLVTARRELVFVEPALRRIAEASWRWLEQRYPYVRLDYFVVMPTHLHGVIVINRSAGESAAAEKVKPLGQLVGAFKTVSTKKVNELRQTPGRQLWQEDFYERVVRNDHELDAIRQYIIENPLKWEADPNNPRHPWMRRHSRSGSRAAATRALVGSRLIP